MIWPILKCKMTQDAWTNDWRQLSVNTSSNFKLLILVVHSIVRDLLALLLPNSYTFKLLSNVLTFWNALRDAWHFRLLSE